MMEGIVTCSRGSHPQSSQKLLLCFMIVGIQWQSICSEWMFWPGQFTRAVANENLWMSPLSQGCGKSHSEGWKNSWHSITSFVTLDFLERNQSSCQSLFLRSVKHCLSIFYNIYTLYTVYLTHICENNRMTLCWHGLANAKLTPWGIFRSGDKERTTL